MINHAESPVAKLARQRGGGKSPFLDPAALLAAERFRIDFERGHLQPRTTTDWSSFSGTTRSGSAGGRSDLTHATMAARQRVAKAVSAVGPELGGILVDVCCYLKGLESVERERRWPSRSAKLVLKLGLAALSRHYGLSEMASGVAKSGIGHWGSKNYHPSIDGE